MGRGGKTLRAGDGGMEHGTSKDRKVWEVVVRRHCGSFHKV